MPSWLAQGNNAVITGGASGIGLAAAAHYLQHDMNVLIADANEDALAAASEQLSGKSGQLYTQRCDVSELAQVQALQRAAEEKLGAVHCLMNNAGAVVPRCKPWEAPELWRKQLDINLWGIIHGCQSFVPSMLAAGQSAAIINTGSKQGITNPPGGYAYNLSKAGVKAYTESLAHALREEPDCTLSVHLLVPGFTYTGMIARFVKEKPPGAWTSEQVVAFLLQALDRNEFYVLCPDNETPRELDAKRIQWNTDDLIKGRSALSRWDAQYAAEYEKFIAEGTID